MEAVVKQATIAKFRTHESDTGSSEIQIAVLSGRIKELTEHFKAHKHDHHSRRGLLKMVANRRKHLSYLKRKNLEGYKKIIAELGLRK